MSSKTAKPKVNMSKTDFILEKTVGLSAEEAVAAAKKAGITISTGYVYTIRASAKKKAAKPLETRHLRAKQKPGAMKAPATGGYAVSHESVGVSADGEATFVAMASHIGLGRARALLDQMAERVSRVLGS